MEAGRQEEARLKGSLKSSKRQLAASEERRAKAAECADLLHGALAAAAAAAPAAPLSAASLRRAVDAASELLPDVKLVGSSGSLPSGLLDDPALVALGLPGWQHQPEGDCKEEARAAATSTSGALDYARRVVEEEAQAAEELAAQADAAAGKLRSLRVKLAQQQLQFNTICARAR